MENKDKNREKPNCSTADKGALGRADRKRCTHCRKVKTLSDFYRQSSRNADGSERYRSACKACTSSLRRAKVLAD